MINSLSSQQESVVNTVAATKRLARALMVSAGEFSLILASCNSINRQQQILSLLTEFSSVDIQEIHLTPETETLYTTIATNINAVQPGALMVRGLESVVEINQLIISTNLMRDEFRKKFHCPLVLWVNDETLRKLVWLAPDLKDWASSTIRFDTPNTTVERKALIA
ncbi:hypothetical protein [Calothrix sp. PCC 7507]|uniref:hypothetical protein n=1 Tax=Calothrix sp. PCC 7507 TaxID=99598 RepID=UPI00029EFE89|nr:hypothetical protein [Calothrix sp. PCC 7507]AFY34429.1 WD repeat-containing protein [Calothrix sp. PCC 7507]